MCFDTFTPPLAWFSINPERNQRVDFVFFLFILAGCSRVARDKVLRVFFDGVPAAKENNPSIVKDGSHVIVTQGIEVTASAVQSTNTYFHSPFLEKQCDTCHDTKSSQKLISSAKDLCFTCHEDFTKNKKTVHYPVNEGTCLECHDPHQSPNKFILKKTIPQICFNCHEEKDIKANPAHEEQNNCLECHNPHASNEEKLLK